MNIEVKNSLKAVDYAKSMNFLEKRVNDESVIWQRLETSYWIEYLKKLKPTKPGSRNLFK